MIRNHWFGVATLAALAPVVIACGGSVDLDHRSGAGGSGSGGSSSTGSSAGGLAMEPVGRAGDANGGGGSDTMHTPGSDGGSAALPTGGASTGGASSVTTKTGAWLAFDGQNDAETRGVYLVFVPDGNQCLRRLTPLGSNAKQPAFSSDGKLLAYVSDVSGSQQIYALDLSSGRTRQLTHLEGGASYPAFSPSGNALVFVSGDPEPYRDGTAAFTSTLGEVQLLDMKTLATQTLLPRDPLLGPWSAPVFSGEDRILTANGHQLEAIYLLNGAFDDHQTVSNRGLAPQDPAPSPDGQRVTFIDKCAGVNTLYTMRLDGSQDHTCDSTPLVPADLGYRSPDWGNFGFIAVEFDQPEHGLWLWDPTEKVTGHVVGVTMERNPTWAPLNFTYACTD